MSGTIGTCCRIHATHMLRTWWMASVHARCSSPSPPSPHPPCDCDCDCERWYIWWRDVHPRLWGALDGPAVQQVSDPAVPARIGCGGDRRYVPGPTFACYPHPSTTGLNPHILVERMRIFNCNGTVSSCSILFLYYVQDITNPPQSCLKGYLSWRVASTETQTTWAHAPPRNPHRSGGSVHRRIRTEQDLQRPRWPFVLSNNNTNCLHHTPCHVRYQSHAREINK
jgi:hypothetical protein